MGWGEERSRSRTETNSGRSGPRLALRSHPSSIAELGLLVSTINADRWRGRADEMRQIAEGMTVIARAKASILRTAEEYERLAETAERSASRRNDQAGCSAYKNKRLQSRPGASWET